ncbi:pilus assembly protein [Acidovorax sp. Leaf160]|uniref:pilus assembly protein n=1 Tax=Acidovorax sp. Leaf160 TaxID=1736280 RepID=UPI0009EA75DA|nr:PilC/PilY family type IV pilus protein [Acidovorax sp. Leaf160]
MRNKVLLRTVIGGLVTSMGAALPAAAAPLNLAQYPAGSASRQPPPNVIVSVDNSGSMGTNGINALKAALKDTFAPANLPDGSIRLAYQSMWNCNTIPSTHASCASGGVSWNTMRELQGGTTPSEASQRGQFFRWIDTLNAANGTPSHAMMRNAGEYLRTTGAANPWNAEPGTVDNSPQTCRRSYHILMTDGGWNNTQSNTIGNADGTNTTFPDGTVYDAGSAQSKIYSDAWGYGAKWGDKNKNDPLPTLSDMAFYYWATDLQNGIPNGLTPLIRKAGDEVFTNQGKSVTINEYWNPKNNPANWQNMVTYTIGYNSAADWQRNNANTNPLFNTAQGMYGGDFAAAIVGNKYWLDPINNDENGRREELWHMAINSRGKFYPAKTSEDLKNAFNEIVGGIINDNSKPITGYAGSGTTNIRADLAEYVSGYEADKWKGYVYSNVVAKTSGTKSANPAWGIINGQNPPKDRKTTADKLDELASVSTRVILTTNDATGAAVPFEWDVGVGKLSAAQKAVFNASDNLGEDRVNFLRGDRTKEGNTAARPFRERASRQGDIVNSSVWYVKGAVSNFNLPGYTSFLAAQKARIPMVYVGGNDGMLHGFSAVDGMEKIAYVPKGVIKTLPLLTSSNYAHRYYVDGSPFTGDVDVGTNASDWRTLLVGSLGAGGKGYFVMDVTKPGTTDNSIASNFTTNATDRANVVLMDKTLNKADAVAAGSDEADLGHIFATPVVDEANPAKTTQIAKLNNGRWAVIMGNGYNSTNERPVLLIQYLSGPDRALKKIVAASTGTNAVGNGLSAPRVVDINGDGSPDVVYAGDLKGNLWKFDLLSNNADNWGVAFSGSPFYTATYQNAGVSSTQPITAAPTVKANDRGVGGVMVAFGTGQNVTEADRTDISKQTIYSILDSTRYKLVSSRLALDTSVTVSPVGTGTTDLVAQTLVGTAINGDGNSSGRVFWKMSANTVTYTGANAKKGWYFNLPETGERLLKTMQFFDNSNVLEVLTQVPASGGNSQEETCSPSPQEEKQFRTLLNIMDGRKPNVQVMDLNGDGIYNTADNQDRGVSRMSTSKGAKGIAINKRIIKSGDDSLARLPEQALRPSWRQMQ